jgi:hypothetical protein
MAITSHHQNGYQLGGKEGETKWENNVFSGVQG